MVYRSFQRFRDGLTQTWKRNNGQGQYHYLNNKTYSQSSGTILCKGNEYQRTQHSSLKNTRMNSKYSIIGIYYSHKNHLLNPPTMLFSINYSSKSKSMRKKYSIRRPFMHRTPTYIYAGRQHETRTPGRCPSGQQRQGAPWFAYHPQAPPPQMGGLGTGSRSARCTRTPP